MLASKFGHNARSVMSRNEPLTNDQIARVAPSIFAEVAHFTRSERYAQIPTVEVLQGLREHGFMPFYATQTATRKADRRDFTKHMLRLRHVDHIAAGPGEVNEIILLNSHDGTSSYQMLAGCFRFVCSNGLILGDTSADIRVRHTGDIKGDVIEGAYSVLDSFERITESKAEMREIAVPAAGQHALAQAALDYRYGVRGEEGVHQPVQAQQLLTPRRYDDRQDDLWTTFNRVQENLIKGGIGGRTQKGQRRRTAAVRGIDNDVKLNRALWTMAESMKDLLA